MQQTRKPGPQRALVLAGGGAKGSYQVGVWQALQELGWTPDIITGASVGALNGCLFPEWARARRPRTFGAGWRSMTCWKCPTA